MLEGGGGAVTWAGESVAVAPPKGAKSFKI